jgi:ribonuclease G
MSHETIAYELERELITYGNIEDEAVLIAAPKELQKQFLQKELQKNIPFEIYFKDDNIEKYAIVRFGSKKEIVERKK